MAIVRNRPRCIINAESVDDYRAIVSKLRRENAAREAEAAAQRATQEAEARATEAAADAAVLQEQQSAAAIRCVGS